MKERDEIAESEMRCPECGSLYLRIIATETVTVYVDGSTEEVLDTKGGDIEWTDDSPALCDNCPWTGSVGNTQKAP